MRRKMSICMPCQIQYKQVREASDTRHLGPKHVDGSHEHPEKILPYATREEVEPVESQVASLTFKLLHVSHCGIFEFLLGRCIFSRD